MGHPVMGPLSGLILLIIGIVAFFSFKFGVKNPFFFPFFIKMLLTHHVGKTYRILLGKDVWEVTVSAKERRTLTFETGETMFVFKFVNAAYKHNMQYGFTKVNVKDGSGSPSFGRLIGKVE